MKKYIKLCKNQNFIGKRSRLLMSDDHLLLIDNLYGFEEYRRFFFKDLCSITIYRTLTGFITNIVIGLLLFLVSIISIGLIALGSSKNTGNFIGFGIFFGIIAFINIIILIINFIKGPTAKTAITTLNSEDTVILSGYFYKTRKIIDKIQPLIIAQQGEFTQVELVERIQKE